MIQNLKFIKPLNQRKKIAPESFIKGKTDISGEIDLLYQT